ncbi:rhombosortase [Thalassotalea sp. G2M2-11]|uniref:rhombosortase n=1 Tax=Thalassotalea sp. G2M2-11 TaxID=2787627 RepID=UPI0019CF61AC|nr:rhombosortase [Thalassotalea sp. G2M2-11]
MLQIKSLPTKSSAYAGPLILLVLALGCHVFNDQFSQLFIYQRNTIEQFQLWRLLTGHLFHTNNVHLLLNGAAIILLWSIHGQYYSLTQYLTLLLFSALMISGAIFIFDPQMEEYVGLSGVLHSLFIWGALQDIKAKEKTGYLLLAGVLLKVAHEQYFGASKEVAALINANVAIDAHLWGVIAGICYFFVISNRIDSVAPSQQGDNKKAKE